MGGDDARRRRLAATFDSAATLYERARPGFPRAAVDWILPSGAERVLDLGAGTGKLTAALLGRDAAVVAIDPSENMLEVLRNRHPEVGARIGTAEATGLADASVDAVLVGSAFHWFDRPAADAEIARVLRPGGRLGLLWNRRDPSSELVVAFDEAQRHRTETHPEENLDTVPDPRWFTAPLWRDFPQTQRLDAEGLVDLVASRSYVIALADAERERLLARVRAVAVASTPGGFVDLPYLTMTLRCERLGLG